MQKTIYVESYRLMIHKFRTKRIEKGFTQTELGKKVGRSRAWVGKVEQCEIKLDVLYLVRICRALGLKPEDIIGELTEKRRAS